MAYWKDSVRTRVHRIVSWADPYADERSATAEQIEGIKSAVDSAESKWKERLWTLVFIPLSFALEPAFPLGHIYWWLAAVFVFALACIAEKTQWSPAWKQRVVVCSLFLSLVFGFGFHSSESGNATDAVERFYSARGFSERREVDIRKKRGVEFRGGGMNFKIRDYIDTPPNKPTMIFEMRFGEVELRQGKRLMAETGTVFTFEVTLDRGCFAEVNTAHHHVFFVVLENRLTDLRVGVLEVEGDFSDRRFRHSACG